MQLPVCDANNTNIGPSWCYYRNPVITPQIILGSATETFNPQCGTEPNSTCLLVTGVHVFQTSTPARDFKFTVSGFVQGGLALYELQSFTVSYMNLALPAFAARNQSINLLASYTSANIGVLAVGGLGGSTLQLFAENSTRRVVAQNLTADPLAFQSCAVLQFAAPLQAIAFVAPPTDYVPHLLVLLVRGSTYSVQVVRVAGCGFGGYGSGGAAINATFDEWTFDAESVFVGRVNMRVVMHYAGTNSTNATFDATPVVARDPHLTARSLLLIHDTVAAALYLLDGTRGAVLPFAREQAAVAPVPAPVVYVAPVGFAIGGLTISPEVFRRATLVNTTSGTQSLKAKPSQSLWVSAGLVHGGIDSGGRATLTMVMLPEFGAYQTGLTASMDFPIGAYPRCADISQFYDPDSDMCLKRQQYTQELAAAPQSVQCGTVGFPSGNATVQLSPAFQRMNETAALAYLKEAVTLLANPALVQDLLENAWLNVIAVSDVKGRVTIFGAQEQLLTANQLSFAYMNQLDFIGPLADMELSPNAQYVFAAVGRQSWEMASKVRLYEICTILANDTDQPFLKAYRPQCDQMAAAGALTLPSYFDFMQFSTSCPATAYCPSFVASEVSLMPGGYYSPFSFTFTACFPGSFCPPGGGQQPCPPGFVCPDFAMTYPTRCAANPYHNTTCAERSLVRPKDCPEGQVCVMPYFYPQGAMPGHYVAHRGPRVEQYPCTRGDWCALGRSSNQDLRCPAYAYCTNDAELTPIVCACDASSCSYCPEGTWDTNHMCPAGSYCSDPNTTHVCYVPQYCPAGSVVYKECPAGSYCPTPEESFQCPEHHYCPIGTFLPIPCPPLTLCPAGSANQAKGFAAFLAFVAVIAFALIASYLFGRWRRRMREISDRIHEHNVASKSPQLNAEQMALLGLTEEDEEQGSGYGTGALSATETYLGFRPRAKVLDIEFRELGLELKTGGTVLAGVTGTVRHGRVTAVMGPSGAGKTTFLSVLSGKADYGRVTGTVLLNGVPDKLERYRKFVGFVPQEDTMLREMTVRETLMFSALMRLGVEVGARERSSIVDNIIDTLGLYRVRHSPIGDETKRGISGGQRKRVNIGMELVAGPTVLFLDEPTSGLDAASSLVVCGCLRQCAEVLDLTIVTVIHQPRYEIFTSFHDVLLLGEGGRTVYLGPSVRALDYFTEIGFRIPPHINPADFFMDIIAGDVVNLHDRTLTKDCLPQKWASIAAATAGLPPPRQATSINVPTGSDNGGSTGAVSDPEESNGHGVIASALTDHGAAPAAWHGSDLVRRTRGFWFQIAVFCGRGLLQYGRSIWMVVLDFILVAICGAFSGLIFLNFQYKGPVPKIVQNICPDVIMPLCQQPLDNPLPSVALFACLSIALTSVAASLRIFGPEKAVFWREAARGANPLAYYLGKTMANLPFMILSPVIYLCPFYQLAVPRGSFALYYISLLAIQFTSMSFGILVSVLIPIAMSQLAAVVSILACMMFSGARPTLPEMSKMFFPLPYVPPISFLRWGQEGLVLIELRTYVGMYDLSTTLSDLGYNLSDSQIALDICMVFVIGVVIRIAAFLVLILKDRGKRK